MLDWDGNSFIAPDESVFPENEGSVVIFFPYTEYCSSSLPLVASFIYARP